MKKEIIASWLVCTLIMGSTALAQQGSPIYRSTDNGLSWHAWNQGLSEAKRVDQILSFKEQYFILTEDQGLFVSSKQAKYWKKPGFSMFLPQKGDVIHAFNKLLWLGTYQNGILVSSDQGNSWVPCNKGLKDKTIRAFHSHDHNLWVGTNDGIYIWNSSNNSWEQQLDGIQVNDFAQQGERLFVATHQGIQMSTDQGKHWKQALGQGAIKQLYQWNKQLYACSMHRQVWKYDSVKANWIDDSGAFPAEGLSTTILYGDDEVIYITQGKHLYRKFNTKHQWELVSKGLGDAAFFRDLKMVRPGVLLLACAVKP